MPGRNTARKSTDGRGARNPSRLVKGGIFILQAAKHLWLAEVSLQRREGVILWVGIGKARPAILADAFGVFFEAIVPTALAKIIYWCVHERSRGHKTATNQRIFTTGRFADVSFKFWSHPYLVLRTGQKRVNTRPHASSKASSDSDRESGFFCSGFKRPIVEQSFIFLDELVVFLKLLEPMKRGRESPPWTRTGRVVFFSGEASLERSLGLPPCIARVKDIVDASLGS